MSEEAVVEKKPSVASIANLNKERDEAIQAKLEEFLLLAKAGELSDIAIIAKVKGEPLNAFDWDSDNPMELVGSLEIAKQQIYLDLLEDHEDEEDDED